MIFYRNEYSIREKIVAKILIIKSCKFRDEIVISCSHYGFHLHTTKEKTRSFELKRKKGMLNFALCVKTFSKGLFSENKAKQLYSLVMAT